VLESPANPSASNASDIRRRNRRLMLHELRLRGSLSRAELARATGLTPPAIASIIQDLLDAGLVREAGRRKSARGQPPIEIEIAREGGYAVGLRVETRGYDFVVSDLGGEVVASGQGEIPGEKPEELLEFLAVLYEGLAEKYGAGRSLGLGLVTPGPFDAIWPGIPTPGAIAALQTRSLVERLTARIGVDVFLENDATAAALGERLAGVAREVNHFFYVFVGEGVGGGIVIKGESYRGESGNAGEFGHLIVDPAGPRCYCGNSGCLGQYLSLSSLRQFKATHPDETAEAAEEEWLAGAARALSLALVTIENLLDPEMIVLGGAAPGQLLTKLFDRIGEMLPSVRLGRQRRLLLSDLGERSASYGASTLPIIAVTSPF
jgi:predicted NBD/HSP70 family sugar kinase